MKIVELGSNELPMTYPPPATAIWRYMNLAKFLSLLATSTLWFPRADFLGDPFEGSRSAAIDDLPPETRRSIDSFTNVATTLLPMHFVSCWSMSGVESAALWDIYSGKGSGIAIRSTVGSLRTVLEAEPSHEWVTVAAVNYRDYQTGYVPLTMVKERLFYKRTSFAHEHELRAVMNPMDWIGENWVGPSLERAEIERQLPRGWPIPADLSTLVHAVYVSPLSENWFLEAVRSLIARYGLAVGAERSDLDRDAVF